MKRGVSAWAQAALGSVLVHGLLVVAWLLSPEPPAEEKTASETVQLRFIVPAPQPVPPPQLEPAPAPEPKPVAMTPRKPRVPKARRKPRKPRTPAPAVASGEGPTGSERDTTQLPTDAEPAEPSAKPPTEDLDFTIRAPTPSIPRPQLILPQGRSGPALAEGPKLMPRADGGYEIKEGQFSARIAPDGSLTFTDKTAMQKWGGLSYQIDVTDEIMRAVGNDPYGYQKNQIRVQTQALREKMASDACRARYRDSLTDLRGQLGQIWADTSKPVRARRHLLFQLWDECAEEGDPELLQFAAMARETIYAFVRRELPDGSELGFREEELSQLNRDRHSKARFEP